MVAHGRWLLAVNALGDEVFATPVIADDGKLFIRTRGALFCFGKTEPQRAAR